MTTQKQKGTKKMSIHLPSKVYSTYMQQASSLHCPENHRYVQIPYQKPQSQMKDLNAAVVLKEKNDGANDVYRNASARATQAADIDRYSQGTFDLSFLVAGRNSDSYFSGTMSSPYDVDYFHVDTMSQILSRRPVIVNMEMPEGADYDLAVYDSEGNQVGMAVSNEDGTKTLTIPCDWSDCRNFVIKISQHDTEQSVEGSYKLTFSQGDMPEEVTKWLERVQGKKFSEDNQGRYSQAIRAKEENEARNAAGIVKLHEKQFEELPEELKYRGTMSASELLEEERNGRTLSEAERAYVAIFGNQEEIYQGEAIRRKAGVRKEFSEFLESMGLSGKSFEFYLPPYGSVRVSGLDGEEKKAVEDYITEHRENFQNIYLETSKETQEMTDYQYRLAGYVEECNRFLGKLSDGKISVDDLSIKRNQTGIIVNEGIEGLPYQVASLINGADSTSRFFDYKQMMYEILQYRENRGELPQYHMKLGWDGQNIVE